MYSLQTKFRNMLLPAGMTGDHSEMVALAENNDTPSEKIDYIAFNASYPIPLTYQHPNLSLKAMQAIAEYPTGDMVLVMGNRNLPVSLFMKILKKNLERDTGNYFQAEYISTLSLPLTEEILDILMVHYTPQRTYDIAAFVEHMNLNANLETKLIESAKNFKGAKILESLSLNSNVSQEAVGKLIAYPETHTNLYTSPQLTKDMILVLWDAVEQHETQNSRRIVLAYHANFPVELAIQVAYGENTVIELATSQALLLFNRQKPQWKQGLLKFLKPYYDLEDAPVEWLEELAGTIHGK